LNVGGRHACPRALKAGLEREQAQIDELIQGQERVGSSRGREVDSTEGRRETAAALSAARTLMTFSTVYAEWSWKPLPNCPGRFAQSTGSESLDGLKCGPNESRVSVKATAPPGAGQNNPVAGEAEPHQDTLAGPRRSLASRLTPQSLAPDVAIVEHRVAGARDPVLVARFEDGGLISYRRADGTYVHTLNTREGLERKLAQLGIG
jgi:hypothetical protein